jgi:hypothetical protein
MNFIKKVALVLTFFAIHVPVFPQKSAVTYTFSGGRFGDSLIAYCHAVWIAYQYKLDLLYKPFKYSDQLMMHDLDMHYLTESATHYKQTVHINHLFHNGMQPDTLYVVPYFPESHIERNDPRCPFLFQVDWNDEGYINVLKKRIASKNLLSLPRLPNDCITVAVHVRKGTGWDIPQFAPNFEKLTEMHPLKWPPDSYYIAQIKRIIDLFPEKQIYIYVFTDHDKPAEIIEKYKAWISGDQITWVCRQEQNKHDLNVLEDFFALTLFDCLIRNESNFSYIASKLSSYKVLIGPWESTKKSSGQIEISSIYYEVDSKAVII